MVARIGLVGVLFAAIGLGAALAVAPTDDMEIAGTVKELSVSKKFFVIAVKQSADSKDASEKKFLVNRETKFTGPRGANREDGLQDPCMAVGYDVRVLPAKDEQYAKEIKLSPRKVDEEKKKGKKGG